MLKPAICYKGEIIEKFHENYFSEDAFLYNGGLYNFAPHIVEDPDDNVYQFAIINSAGTLIGYLSYNIDWHAKMVCRISVFSFDKGNLIVPKDLFDTMEELYNKFHRIEWSMTGGNPAEKGYDSFCKLHNGTKHILKDALCDKDNNYRDSIIYEIINPEI